ncbi:dTDP-4-dehydrorhamnose reductase [Mycolicibacterium pulveris]|nr:dTDP-4-dehydrorhamnose reductase [Mycolicibacterium pulveris]
MTRSVRAGISPGYLRDRRNRGSARRRARLETVAKRTSHRIVIPGAGGMVGRVLAAQGRLQGGDVLALTSSQCDITDPAAVARVIAPGDVVINCAAYTKVDAAEADPERAQAVNATGPGNLARACATAGARLIHISTDYVFSGTQRRPYEIDDETGPLSVYGRTKLAGERAVLEVMPDAHVVRTSWVYEGGDGGDFVAVMRRRAAGDQPVEAVADQVGSPTYAGDLVAALLEVADGDIDAPVLHAANEGEASRFEQAQAVFEAVGADPARVRPVGSDQHPRPAPRPAYSALSGRRSAAAGLTPLRPWRDALTWALGEHGVAAR